MTIEGSKTSNIIHTPVKYPLSAPGMSSSIQDNCPCRRWLQFPPGQPEGSFSINGGIIGSLSVNGNKICLFVPGRNLVVYKKRGKVFKAAAPLLLPAGFMPLGEKVRALSGNFGAAAL